MKRLIKEISPILEVLIALLLFPIFFIVGIIHSFIRSFIRAFRWQTGYGLFVFVLDLLFLLYQIWNTVKHMLHSIAFNIDLQGNAIAGEFIEDCLNKEEKTLFGKGNITISCAIGERETKGKLNKLGLKVSKLLDFFFQEKEHCLNSYKKYKK